MILCENNFSAGIFFTETEPARAADVWGQPTWRWRGAKWPWVYADWASSATDMWGQGLRVEIPKSWGLFRAAGFRTRDPSALAKEQHHWGRRAFVIGSGVRLLLNRSAR